LVHSGDSGVRGGGDSTRTFLTTFALFASTAGFCAAAGGTFSSRKVVVGGGGGGNSWAASMEEGIGEKRFPGCCVALLRNGFDDEAIVAVAWGRVKGPLVRSSRWLCCSPACAVVMF
jgi:hypothetical protein